MLVMTKRIKPPYKYEIEMIKNGTFDPDLKEKSLINNIIQEC